MEFGQFRLNYRADKWVASPTGKAGQWTLAQKQGDAYARFIAERIEVPFDSLIKIVIDQMRIQDPGAHVVSEGSRTVSGTTVRMLQIESSPNNIPMTFLGYYYGGAGGAVQVVTYTGRQLFTEKQADLQELLGGLIIVPPSR